MPLLRFPVSILKKPLPFKSGRAAALVAALAVPLLSHAQESRPEMADGLRADGKFWVVVVVLAVIFAGILAYLVAIDKKVSRLERDERRPV